MEKQMVIERLDKLKEILSDEEDLYVIEIAIQCIQERNQKDFSIQPANSMKNFVLGASPPKFARYAGDNNTSTFDVVRVELLLRTYYDGDLLETCKKYQKELMNMALDSIVQSKKFSRYNVPVNMLQAFEAVLTNNKCLRVSFCLKKELEISLDVN